MTPIPRDVDSIENIHGLFEVKLSQGSVALRPDPNPWKEAVRKSNAADPSPRPARRPTFTLFDEPEITPENTAAADNNNWWRWLFVGDLRFVDVGKSVILNDTCLVAWRVAIFALSLAAAIVTGIFAPQPEAFLLPVSHALLAAISPRLIYLAAKKPIDDETTPKFQYSIDAALYRAAQIVVIAAGSHLVNIFQFGPKYMVTTWLTFLLTIACMMDIWFSGMPCSLPSALLAFVVEMILVIFTVYVVNDGTLNGRSFVLLTGVSVLVTMSFALYTNSVYYCFHKTATRENNGGDKRDATEKV